MKRRASRRWRRCIAKERAAANCKVVRDEHDDDAHRGWPLRSTHEFSDSNGFARSRRSRVVGGNDFRFLDDFGIGRH